MTASSTSATAASEVVKWMETDLKYILAELEFESIHGDLNKRCQKKGRRRSDDRTSEEVCGVPMENNAGGSEGSVRFSSVTGRSRNITTGAAGNMLRKNMDRNEVGTTKTFGQLQVNNKCNGVKRWNTLRASSCSKNVGCREGWKVAEEAGVAGVDGGWKTLQQACSVNADHASWAGRRRVRGEAGPVNSGRERNSKTAEASCYVKLQRSESLTRKMAVNHVMAREDSRDDMNVGDVSVANLRAHFENTNCSLEEHFSGDVAESTTTLSTSGVGSDVDDDEFEDTYWHEPPLYMYTIQYISFHGEEDAVAASNRRHTAPVVGNGVKTAVAVPAVPGSSSGGGDGGATLYLRQSRQRSSLRQYAGEDFLRRSRTLSNTYELSQELQDKQVEMLERKYGGAIKARHAARVIQQAFRKYSMNKNFEKMRSNSVLNNQQWIYTRQQQHTEFRAVKGGGGGKGYAAYRTSESETSTISNANITAANNYRRYFSEAILGKHQQVNGNVELKVPPPPELNASYSYGDQNNQRRAPKDRTRSLSRDRSKKQRNINSRVQAENNNYRTPTTPHPQQHYPQQHPQQHHQQQRQYVQSKPEARRPFVPQRSSSLERRTSNGKPPVVRTSQNNVTSNKSPQRPVIRLDKVHPSPDERHAASPLQQLVDSRGLLHEISSEWSQHNNNRVPVAGNILKTYEQHRMSNLSEDSEGGSLDGTVYSSSPTVDSLDDSEQQIGYQRPSSLRHGSMGSSEALTSVQGSPTGNHSALRSADVQRKRNYRVGLNLFNKKPEKGIDYLIVHQFVENSPGAVAKFLISRKGLSKAKIGEYLGNLQQAFNQATLRRFIEEIDLAGMQVDVALRKFQSLFRMPGEAQKIERLMEAFGARYCSCNRDIVSKFDSPDTVFILAYGIIMLNTDLHNCNVKVDKKMKPEDFIKNMRGIDNGHDLDRDMLLGIYERVKSQEFKPAMDHVTQVMKVEQTIVGKKPLLALAHRRLVCYCRLYQVHDPNKKEKLGIHQREVFLFNDMLVVTKIFSKKKGSITYSFRQSYPLTGMQVFLFENSHYLHGMKVMDCKVDGKVLVMFNARNEHDRSKFVEDLRESILEMDEMESLRIEGELERQARLSRKELNNNEKEEDALARNSINRDSGVVEDSDAPSSSSSTTSSGEQLAVKHDSGGHSVKRSHLSNSLIDLSDQAGKPMRRGSAGSLDSGMSSTTSSVSRDSSPQSISKNSINNKTPNQQQQQQQGFKLGHLFSKSHKKTPTTTKGSQLPGKSPKQIIDGTVDSTEV